MSLHLQFFVLVLWIQSVVAQVERQVVIPNHSPTILYEPYSDGIAPANGWTIWTSADGFIPKLGQDALGDIFHITSLHGAQFSLSFYGTGVSLNGISNATYQVLVDDAELPVSGSEDLLFQATNMELKDHVLVLKVTSNGDDQVLSFANATVTTNSPKELASTEYSFDSDKVKFTGNWTSMYTLDHGPVKRTSDLLASVSMTFSGARAISIHSNIYFSRWLYDVELDGKKMFAPGSTNKQFNASTLWTVSDTILFFADNLDEGRHTIKMIHPFVEDFWSTTFRSFEVWRADGNSDELDASGGSGPSAGTYAGIVVGAIIAAALAVAAAWYFLHRHRRRHLRPQYDGPIMTQRMIQGEPDDVTQLPLPSPFISSPTSGRRGGGTHSTTLVYETSPSTSDRKGGRLTANGYSPGHVPDVQYAVSPVQSGPERTDEALPEVTSPPPAYGTGIGAGFPRN